MRGHLKLAGLAALAVGLVACASGKEERRDEPAATEETAPPPVSPDVEPAPEAPQGQARQGELPARPESRPLPARPHASRAGNATRQVAIIDAGLIAAAAHARALQTLGATPGAWDAEQGQLLVDNARDSLADARRQLDHLTRSAGQDNREQLDELDRRIGAAEDAFDRLAGALDRPERVADEAGNAYAELTAAVPPLRDVARAMNTGIEVLGPTG